MKKVIAILLAISTLFLLCSCSNSIISKDVSREERKLLKSVHQELMQATFRTEAKIAASTIDAEYILTFSEDTITYQVTHSRSDGTEYTYANKVPYTLSIKKELPYIVVSSEHYEGMYVILIDENQREEGGDTIKGLQGSKSQMGFYYSRIK